jgi:hypothetical protein
MTLPLVRKFTGIKVIGMDDDDVAVTPVFARFINQSDIVLTPDCLAGESRGKKHRVYPSYHELAYLHPDRFTPDPSVKLSAGILPAEQYFVLRFNAFNAHHDAGSQGLTSENRIELINLLKPYGRVLITTENITEPEFESYRIAVSPEKIHSLLYYATLFIGDSQTMTTEAALLGTPAFKCNTFAGKLSIPNEIEQKYKLCFSYQPHEFNNMLENIKQHLEMPGLKQVFGERRASLLKDKTDLTAFLVNLVESYTL